MCLWRQCRNEQVLCGRLAAQTFANRNKAPDKSVRLSFVVELGWLARRAGGRLQILLGEAKKAAKSTDCRRWGLFCCIRKFAQNVNNGAGRTRKRARRQQPPSSTQHKGYIFRPPAARRSTRLLVRSPCAPATARALPAMQIAVQHSAAQSRQRPVLGHSLAVVFCGAPVPAERDARRGGNTRSLKQCDTRAPPPRDGKAGATSAAN